MLSEILVRESSVKQGELVYMLIKKKVREFKEKGYAPQVIIIHKDSKEHLNNYLNKIFLIRESGNPNPSFKLMGVPVVCTQLPIGCEIY